MTPEALVVLTLVGACLILLFWRTLLELLIVCAAFCGLGLIWSADMPPVWLKGVLTVALLAVLGLIAEKLGLRLGERTQTGRRRRSASVGAPNCTRCGNSGSVLCGACHGSGEGPGSAGLVLGRFVPCSFCNGRGRTPCGCGR
ncbi:hypothetical protein [Methyloversatilis discipulorum]|uniref:hypothetical protein n=1 Tax=Methyloversatilis discipulorum TaxID=1119528 RepID=UPI00037ECB31|nr:hypothetical protein [Methyloversatilis discipulorum]